MDRKYLYALLLVSSFSSTIFAGKKILFLVSTPRSLSTAFLRAIQARGEVDARYGMDVFNEPFMPVWWANNGTGAQAVYREDSLVKTYQPIVDQLLQEAEQKPIFIKEQSFIVQSLLRNDDRLFTNPDVTFAMLLRNPHHSIISFYNKLGKVIDGFSAIVGHKGCYEVFQEIKTRTGKAPEIVISEDLYGHSYEAMQRFCERVDIPFVPEALRWQSLGSSFDGTQLWHEAKKQDKAQYWHGDAIMSTGFEKPRQYDVDEQGNPTFSEIEKLEDREACKKVYEENTYYYNLILQSVNK